MLVPSTAKSMISGIAKSPMVAAISETPSQRKSELSSPSMPVRVNRGTLSIGSRPTIANTKPRPPPSNPFGTLSPLREAIKVMPRKASMKNSAEPIERTRGLTIGIASARTNAPKTAPISELVRDAPSARPAWPFFAIGWPSTTSAADMPSPGTPKRIEVTSPVVAVTALEPRRKANAVVGSML